MKIADPAQDTLVNEVKLMLAELPFDGASVLELGCGKAEKRPACWPKPAG